MNNRYKYPRTFHLPWSEGLSNDDKVISSLDGFKDKRVIATIKMDGENSTIYNDYYHARSIDSKDHPSRHWLKGFANKFMYEIPDGYRVCGENLYAKHSIEYSNLKSYFYGFSMWHNEKCLDWDTTLEWFELFDVKPVEVLYDDIFNLEEIYNLHKNIDTEMNEGYVLRIADKFNYSDFSTVVAKWVRKSHVQTDEHWMNQKIIPNQLEK